MGSHGSVWHESLRANSFQCVEFESDVRSAPPKHGKTENRKMQPQQQQQQQQKYYTYTDSTLFSDIPTILPLTIHFPRHE